MNVRSLISLLILLTLKPCISQAQEKIDPALQAMVEQFESCVNDGESTCEEVFDQARSFVDGQEDVLGRCAGLFLLYRSRENMGLIDDKALAQLTLADELFTSVSDYCGRARVHADLSGHARYTSNLQKSHRLAEQAMELAQTCGDTLQLAYCHKNLGIVLQDLGNYADALKEFNTCYRLGAAIADHELMGIALTEMSNIHSVLGEYDLALRKGIQAAEFYKKAGLDMRYARCILNLTADFISLEQPDSVIKYLSDVEPIIRDKDKIAEAFLQYNLGEAFKLKEDYEKALGHYTISEKGIANVGFQRLEVEIDLSRAQCYASLGNAQRAYDLVKIAQEKAKGMSDAEGEMNVLQYTFEYGYEAGSYQESHEAGLAFLELRDSLLGAQRQEEIVLLQEEFEAERKENQIRLQQQENSLLQEKTKTQRNRLLALLASILLVIAIAFVIYSRQRAKVAAQASLLQLKVLENDKLNQEVAFKNRELSTKALHIAQKNEVLHRLQADLEEMAMEKGAQECVREVVSTLKLERTVDSNWEQFTKQFTELNPDFYKQLSDRYEGLTKNDLRLAALLRMNLSSKDIAMMLSISDDGIKKARQRFRKKLDLRPDESLEALILSI